MIATKIIATIGPASQSKEQIELLLRAGVNIFRFNLKHGNLTWHKEKAQLVQQISKEQQLPVALLFDLRGAEIRTGETIAEGITLKYGEIVEVTDQHNTADKHILIPNSLVVTQLREGDRLLIDDGRIILHITERSESGGIKAEVRQGGHLLSNKSVTIPSLVDLLPSVTDADRENIALAKELQIDFLALSYVRKKQDILSLQALLQELDYKPAIIAKVETAEAIQYFEDILEVSDAIMIARGDLGVELSPEQVPYYQKHIINRCNAVGKPVITATQMLESMINNPYPTRAEISDVANAIYDHTDAIMLSAETAIGSFGKEAVGMMVSTAKFIEQHLKPSRVTFEMKNQTDALTHAAAEFARQHYPNVPSYQAFILLTESGYSSRMISRHRHPLPIIALTRHEHVMRRLLLQWGVTPVYFPHEMKNDESSSVMQIEDMLNSVRSSNILKKGSYVIVVYGSEWGKPGRTNVLRIEQI